MQKPKTRRIDELDLLRGGLITFVVVDHLQRWPSPFLFLTGEGRLWASAAQGFFIISGLLIGYIRGFKAKDKPMRDITATLVKRAVKLYVWAVAITFVVYGLTRLLPVQSEALIPAYYNGGGGWHFIAAVFGQRYVSDWIYFLRLYWIMLLVAPLAVYLLRKSLWWLLLGISLGVYALSTQMQSPEAALQWQVLFFVAAILGYYLEPLLDWFRRHRTVWRITLVSLMTSAAATILLSFYWVHGWTLSVTRSHMNFDAYVETREWLDPLFSSSPLSFGRIAIGLLWFGGFFALFYCLRKPLQRYLGWYLRPFGQRSLAVYCLQAVVLCFVEAFLPISNSPYYNFGITILLLLGIWLAIRWRPLQRVLPS